MQPRVFSPKVSVVLKNNIGRAVIGGGVPVSQRFAASAREIDLTPYLGEAGSVVVSKSVREPCGMFSVTLADQMVPGQQESLYGLIEPMDVVEIRIARDTALYAGAYDRSMPILMRGIVSNVRRDREMGRGPMRTVTISGQDYGKILQVLRISYLPGLVLGEVLLSSLKLAMRYGVGAQPYSDAAEFITELVDKVVNGNFLAEMRKAASGSATGGSPILDLAVEATKGNGSVFPFGANDWSGGTIWELMSYFGDVGPWNEMFVEDREEGPVLVYRPTPFRDINGSQIQPTESTPDPVVISDEELVAQTVSRGDEDVANYYWVEGARYSLNDGLSLQALAQRGGATPAPFLASYPNSAPNLYGIRPMIVQTQQGMRFDGQPEAEYEQGRQGAIGLLAEKRRILIENNKDNVVLESGSIRLRGNETVRAGKYVTLLAGGRDSSADYYAYQVVHEFAPMRSYLTTINFDRGEGFIERTLRNGGVDSPYLAEMTLRGVGAV